MRRLILQFKLEDIARDEDAQSFVRNIEFFEILHVLKQDEHEMAMIARIRLKSKQSKVKQIFGHELLEAQLLERDKDGTDTYYFRGREQRSPDDLDSILNFGGFMTEPFSVLDGKATITFLGSATEVRNILREIEKLKLPYKILSLTDAKFSPDSPLSYLTDKQRRVIVSAFNSGYYNVPRKINSEELANKLNIRAQTLVMHRRRAEYRLMRRMIDGR